MGEQKVGGVTLRKMRYTPGGYVDRTESFVINHEEEPEGVHWYDVIGVHDPETLAAIGKEFDLHPLLLEDIMNTLQRPKAEYHEQHIFVQLRMMRSADAGAIINEQVSLVVGQNWILSFQEQEGDVFGGVRQRIRNTEGRIKSRGADYLAYALIDAIVDEYFSLLEQFAAANNKLEEEVLHPTKHEHMEDMLSIKRALVDFRRAVVPVRDIISGLMRMEHPYISETTQMYLKDVQDHMLHIIDGADAQRDILSGVRDLHLSIVNNKMNEVMKVLALISTIFLPLSLVAGIYGMNFSWMPELQAPWGYPAALGLMATVALGMFLFFKHRKWI